MKKDLFQKRNFYKNKITKIKSRHSIGLHLSNNFLLIWNNVFNLHTKLLTMGNISSGILYHLT